MSLPLYSPYLIVGAGIHGLSTAYHLAVALRARRRGSGEDIVVIDKTGIAAGASGIACGVIRNNYLQPAAGIDGAQRARLGRRCGVLQPAMRELMAHSVRVWEGDAESYSYHPVGVQGGAAPH